MAWTALILFSAITALAQQDYFSNWPKDMSPQEVGKGLAEHFVTSPHQYGRTINYSEVGTWYGALTFSQLTHDEALRDELIRRFDPLQPGGAEAARIPRRHHVDDSIFGVVPLEIGIETHDPRYIAEGKAWADRQWENPLPNGLSGETRFWIDDMYMLTILQLEAYRAMGDRKYLDRDANEMAAYLDRLQQPNGLFYHAEDVPLFWGRGDGWVAAGMAEMLRSLPPNHPQRPRILAAYRKIMAALLRYQGKDGMWRQLIDHEDAWPETSGSPFSVEWLYPGPKTRSNFWKQRAGRAFGASPLANSGVLGLRGDRFRNRYDLRGVRRNSGHDRFGCLHPTAESSVRGSTDDPVDSCYAAIDRTNTTSGHTHGISSWS